MRIFIQGAGAVGALLGFHLAAAGHVVTLGLRNKLAGNLPDTWPKREGSLILRLIGSNPDSDQAVPVRLTGPAEPPPPADLILLTTKAADAKTAADAAAPALAQGGAAVFLSNGLGMEEAVFGCFPQGTGIRGLVYGGALLESPGSVRSTGEGKIVLAVWEQEETGDPPESGPLDIAVAAFWEAGISTEVAIDPRRSVWEKSMANLAINPLGALARVRNGIVGTDLNLRSVAQGILREACEVAASKGTPIEPLEAEEIFLKAASQTAENRNSMLCDLTAGRTTEIDYLNGYVARIGKEQDLSVPTNAAVTALVKAYHPAEGA